MLSCRADSSTHGGVVDIRSDGAYPSSALSNFAAHEFVFDGVRCASMEGLLQSFKRHSITDQLWMCSLVGANAKRFGKRRDGAWQRIQCLWWNGRSFARQSTSYQYLLDRAFDALATNQDFRAALLSTGNEVLTHSMEKSNPEETVLTEEEFCSRLMKIRERIRG